ncbi:fatty acid desaturase [Pseudoduganella violacea]|uniref:Fatty acid desaturase domain-containing protein n=1 Tax=Pseudoduganella violacea TaxID=1715466 RepID=A0A7W5FSX9_9BURK|nr:fatty acid desaturase [Pseudoduganella violacea]MBB3118011.1 hypothetical protein [Pseudoduganella violacea]
MEDTQIATSDAATGTLVRQSYLRFGRWSQPFWSWLTGKPLPGEAPWLSVAPAYMVLWTIAALVLFSALHLALLGAAAPQLVLLGYLLTPVFAVGLGGGWRMVQVVYAHHAIHSTLLGAQAPANLVAAKLLTVFALAQNQDEYEREHLDHHRRNIFTTLDDADAALLYKFGIRPGIPLPRLRYRLFTTLCSPRYHLWFLKARLLSNLRRPLGWKCLALAWMATVFVGLPLAFGLLPVLLALWLPLILVYQMSALLQFSTEHMWLLSARAPYGTQGYAQRCLGRFCGEMVPGCGGKPGGLAAWLGWSSRLLLLHLPTRLCVLVGDLPAHDWHHLCGQVRHSPEAWPSAIYERQRAIDSGLSAGMELRELWGLPQMIAHVLAAMARAPALELAAQPWAREA